MNGTDIRVAIEQERLWRRKHSLALWYEEPVRDSIEYCLRAENVDRSAIRLVVSSDLLPTKVRGDLPDLSHERYAHHLCHAASAYMLVPPDATAAVVVYDGCGSAHRSPSDNALKNHRETISFFMFGPGGYECVGRTLAEAYIEPYDFPIALTNSVGFFYELVTSILGYDLMDAGKTMGLAAYGQPVFLGELAPFLQIGDSANDAFRCANHDPRLAETLRGILRRGANSFGVRADLAATAQAVVNETLVRCASFLSDRSFDYFCVSGGCGLNAVANTFLIEHAAFNAPVVIPPHADDSGIAFGALWLHARNRDGSNPRMTFRGGMVVPAIARPGREYTEAEVLAAARNAYPRTAVDASIARAEDLVPLLTSGAILGFFDGRSEIGPRALGGRSVLADPRRAAVRERINRRIKQREPFRPLAPVVLASAFGDYFEDARFADPYMIKVARVTERARREVPAVVHADGTARVQVVADDADTALARLLQAFGRETGLPMLLNTSFNRRGEPIVESPADAFEAFLAMGLDGLYINGAFYRSAEP
ncbi:MAG: carbamoyltransferase C-terminal domain-containing protein [Thermoanaerobaculia bacterium]